MTQKDTNEIIAKTMESEKEALFRYACCYLGDIEEAKDILQELFIKLCNTSRIVENTKDLKCYIFRALFNNCKSLMAKKNRISVSSIDSKDIAEIADSRPLDFEQEYILINRLLNTIPLEQSEVIRLHIHGEKTFREIAAIFEIPEASAKSRYRYGIEKLRRMMKESLNS